MKTAPRRKLRLDLNDLEVLSAEEMNPPPGRGVFSMTGGLSCISEGPIMCSPEGGTDTDPYTDPDPPNISINPDTCGSQPTGCSCYTICPADTACGTVY